MTHDHPCAGVASATQLCSYTGEILAQMAGIAKPYVGPRMQAYREQVGAHLRHIIEHYAALAHAPAPSLAAAGSGTAPMPVVDYDARERNLQLETDPVVALEQIAWLARAFGDMTSRQMADPIAVHTRGGLQGQHNFVTRSSLARELMFLNSHATHHFAILQAYAHQRGDSLGAGLGKAPATVAHEQRHTPAAQETKV